MREWGHIKAIHVLRGNNLIYSEMGKYSENTLFPVGCVFKSFLSALVGIAIKQGVINSVDDKVTDYYRQKEINDQRWRQLTIGHVLSKTTGLQWPGPGEELPRNMKEVFNLNFISSPGVVFAYKPDPQILIYLLEYVYQKGIVELMNENLVRRIGDYRWNWVAERPEEMHLPIGLMDNFGKLYLHHGKVEYTDVFLQSYYEVSMKAYSNGGFPECLPYGYGWWIGEYKDIQYYMASGFGGQIIAVVPDKDMVITILSEMDRPHPENKGIVEKIISEQ